MPGVGAPSLHPSAHQSSGRIGRSTLQGREHHMKIKSLSAASVPAVAMDGFSGSG